VAILAPVAGLLLVALLIAGRSDDD
jgi:hypothetical protein